MAPIRLTENNPPSLEDYTAFHGMLCRPKAALRCIESFNQGAVLVIATKSTIIDAEGKNNNFMHFFKLNEKPLFSLNIWTYYLATISTLTLFCSLLRRTRMIKAVEYSDGKSGTSSDESLWRFKRGDDKWIESSFSLSEEKHSPLQLPPEAMEYIINRSIVLGHLPETHGCMKREASKDAKDETEATPLASTQNKITIPEVTLIRRFEYDFGGFISVMMLHFVCTNGRTHLVEILRINDGNALGIFVHGLFEAIKEATRGI